jgi:hypothetical protein
MSDSFFEITEVSKEIVKLDESLAEDGSNGPRLRGALLRVDRDRSQIRYINTIINSINEEALNLINRAVPSFVVLGKHFKILMEDCEKKHFELVMNWKELSSVSKLPLSQRIAAAYKKVNYLIQLIRLEIDQEE